MRLRADPHHRSQITTNSTSYSYRVLCAVRLTPCVSGIVRAVHQSSSKLGDTPLERGSTSLSHCLPGGLAVEPLQQTLQQNRALHRSTTEALRPAADVELYSSTALQSALHLYSSTTLYTLHPLHPPSGSHFSLTSRAGELRSAPSGPDDRDRVAGKRALAPGVRVRRARALK